jgi:hypothetical protein
MQVPLSATKFHSDRESAGRSARNFSGEGRKRWRPDERSPNRVSDFPGASLGSFAVAVYGVGSPSRGELAGRFPQDHIDARVRWSDESS